MKRIKLLSLSLLSGAIFAFSWAPHGMPFLLFLAFIPLFYISSTIEREKLKYPFWKAIGYIFPGLLLWNAATTWWVWNSTPEGSIAMMLLNSFFMSIFWGIWQWFRRKNPPKAALPIAFISLWMTWEYLHLNWDLTWPWLNIGNVFANTPQWVQWYEYTGTFGGCLWILSINFLLYYTIQSVIEHNKKREITYSTIALFLIAIPLLFSKIIYNQYQIDHSKEIEVIVVQQNTDPWEEEYNLSNAEQTLRLIKVCYPLVTGNTDFIVCAESSIPHNIDEEELLQKSYPTENGTYYGFTILDSMLTEFPKLNFILGLSTVKYYAQKESETARELFDSELFADFYNTSALYSSKGCEAVYHKSKLVPGVEKMPFPQIFGFLEDLAVDLGGITGSLGIDKEQKVFHANTTKGNVIIGCPICYESAYGEHFSHFVQNGAEVMAVITNDSWWGDTPGHEQHFAFSRLRAIETRRAILRAANGGNSAFIDAKGDVHQKTKYATRCALKEQVPLNDEITFYTRHGDYLARIAVIISLLTIIYGLISSIKVIHNKKRVRLTQPTTNK